MLSKDGVLPDDSTRVWVNMSGSTSSSISSEATAGSTL